jgi:ATP-dependent RNA helicase SUPV3L1/SUV3
MGGIATCVMAVPGPTNSGKTRLAIERTPGHAPGIVSFPLCLPALKKYDRNPAKDVFLITGEGNIGVTNERLVKL